MQLRSVFTGSVYRYAGMLQIYAEDLSNLSKARKIFAQGAYGQDSCFCTIEPIRASTLLIKRLSPR